jgi:hypothetical protein
MEEARLSRPPRAESKGVGFPLGVRAPIRRDGFPPIESPAARPRTYLTVHSFQAPPRGPDRSCDFSSYFTLPVESTDYPADA